jgi:hypothetical protein
VFTRERCGVALCLKERLLRYALHRLGAVLAFY